MPANRIGFSTDFVLVNNRIGIGTANPTYKLQVVGDFGATTKSFVIPHPTKPNYKLRHACIESPYNGVRYTGKNKILKGTKLSSVYIPEYVKDLIHEEGIAIQITNIKHSKVIWVEDINLMGDYFTVGIENLSDQDLEFYWDLTGIRKDVDQFVVEIEE